MEVKLNSVPVVEAHVHLKIKVTQHHQSKSTEELTMQLFDNGNGDPDIQSNDGIYSRYFTNFEAGEGRYDIEIFVDNIEGKAYTFQNSIRMKLSSFQRIIKGDSLRIMNLNTDNFSPARILDLNAVVNTKESRVELSWTAPGNILDYGKVFKYKVFTSELSESFYKRNTQELTEIPGIQVSGVTELLSLQFEELKRDSYLAIAGINKNGQMAQMSNVVHVSKM